MIRLRVLGAIELCGSHGEELATVLAQPKRLSVLAYLAAASPRGFHRRDSVVALFWPELDDFHARKALNQALGFLRRELPSGGDVLMSRGSEALGVDPNHCWCDAVAFEDAVTEGRYAEALDLYRGDFLQGWFVDQAGGFEEWAERQRARLRGLASDAARAVAEAHRRDGNYTDAIRAAERAVELSRSDERVVRLLLELLDGAGDRAGALQAHADFARSLADDLGVEPSAETRALVDRIRSRTASVVAAVEGAVTRASGVSDSQPIAASSELPQRERDALVNRTSRDASGSPTPVRGRASRWIASGVGATAMSLLIVLGVMQRAENPRSAPNTAQPQVAGAPRASTTSLAPATMPPPVSARVAAPRPAAAAVDPGDPDLVAVLPFRVTGSDTSLAYLREGMLDLLSAKFNGSLRVVDPRTLLAVWRRAGSERADADTMAAASLARRVGAGSILRGSVTSTSATLILAATLSDLRNGATHHAVAEGPRDSMLAVVDRLVTQLLALRAREDLRSVASLRDMPLSAVREYLAGQYLSRRARFEEAIPHYRAAIDADSDFALAGLALGQASLATTGDKAGWLVATRGRNKLNDRDRAILDALIGPTYPVTRPQSEMLAFAERAVRVAPDRVDAWQLLGDKFLEGAIQDVADWPRRAIAAYNRALALDPTNLGALWPLPMLYLRVGDSTRARQAIEQLLRIDSTSVVGSYNLWTAGSAFGDENRRARGLAALGRSRAYSTISNVKFFAFVNGIGFEEQDWLLQQLLESAATDLHREVALNALLEIAVLRGQPTRAARIVDKAPAMSRLFQMSLVSAVFEDADSAAAAGMRDRFAASVEVDAALSNCQAVSLIGLYDLAVRHDSTIAAAAARAIDARLASVTGLDQRCAIANSSLGLMLSMNHGENLRRRAESLDSILRTGPLLFGFIGGLTRNVGNLVLARAWERLKEPRRALAAVRRRSMVFDPAIGFATMLREEGRLAAATGDREGAIRAYRIFIALRRDAEPRLQPQVDAARRELARLEMNKPRH